jgi:hypothetical protein
VSNFINLLSKDGRNLSIDTFIESMQDDDSLQELEEIARAVIAMLIMSCEKPENLDPTDNWYKLLFDKMYEGNNTYERFFDNKINFVTFNYDRSLEQYLLREVCDAFRVSEDDARDRLRERFEVIHVHGSLGSLWDEERPYETRGSDDARAIAEAADSIKLITDKVDTKSEPEFIKAHGLIYEAISVHFVGSGYHSQNMTRIGFDGSTDLRDNGNKFFGTTQGLTRQQFLFNQRQYHINLSINSSSLLSLSIDPSQGLGASQYMEHAPFD